MLTMHVNSIFPSLLLSSHFKNPLTHKDITPQAFVSPQINFCTPIQFAIPSGYLPPFRLPLRYPFLLTHSPKYPNIILLPDHMHRYSHRYVQVHRWLSFKLAQELTMSMWSGRRMNLHKHLATVKYKPEYFPDTRIYMEYTRQSSQDLVCHPSTLSILQATYISSSFLLAIKRCEWNLDGAVLYKIFDLVAYRWQV